MKKIILGFLVVLSAQLIAKEKFHIVVHDQDGVPVKGATVMVRQKRPASGLWFWSSDRYENFFGETDENGKATIPFSARTRHFEWGVGSEDYYSESESTTVHEKFDVKENDDGTDYELTEHEMTRDVTLWKKRNPKAMYGYKDVTHIQTAAPGVCGRFGFDLKRCDWVAPYGGGEVADFYLVRECRKTAEYSEYFGRMEFEGKGGCYKGRKGRSKLFPSVYEADTNAVYLTHIDFRYRLGPNDEKLLIEDLLGYDEFIVLRTRVKCDDSGNIVSANYSKILGKMIFAGFLTYDEIVFNQTPNDNNLERDWKASAKKGLGYCGPMAP